MKVLRILFAAAKAWPWLFAVNLFLWASFHTLPTVFGIAVGDVFDGLEMGDEDMVVAALWLFGAIVLGRVVAFETGVVVYTTLWHKWQLLLRRNLLRWLMVAKGSRVMPVSTGAAVSTFREDVDEGRHDLDRIFDEAGFGRLWLLFEADRGLHAPLIDHAATRCDLVRDRPYEGARLLLFDCPDGGKS